MKSKTSLIAAALLTALAATANAGDSGTIYGAVSTNGLGIGYAKSVSDNVALRGQYNSYSRNFSGSIADTGSTGNSTWPSKWRHCN